MIYCAMTTSFWTVGNRPDESFVSENFDEAFSFCSKRQDKCKAAVIIKVEDQKETEIVSFRTIK